jgi:hypothetical protein
MIAMFLPGPTELLIIAVVVGVVIAVLTSNQGSQTADSRNPKLRPCPDCGRYVSKRALSCPHCGGPVKGY